MPFKPTKHDLHTNQNHNILKMNAEQFAYLLKQMQQTLTPLATLAAQQEKVQTMTPAPRLNVKLPTYRGDPEENIYIWCLQLGSIFNAQGIDDATTQINYASTALEGGALHWYLNQCQAKQNKVPYSTWDDFVMAMKAAFQLPHYQQYL